MGVCVVFPSLPGVHNQFLGLLGVECENIVGTPHCQMLKHLPVGHLIIAAHQAFHCGVVCKLDYGARVMYRYAVMGEEGEENWAQNIALWYASVQGEDVGVEIVNPNRLWSVSEKA